MSETWLLRLSGLCATIQGKPILNGVTLEIRRGEIHALMGPNGSGKSTLSHVLMGHPDYTVTAGRAEFLGRDLLSLPTEERAKAGLFLSFQHPVAVPGVTVAQFLKAAVDARADGSKMKSSEFLKQLRSFAAYLDLDPSFLNRSVNDGFSGGERKRLEILQLLMLNPAMAILDEADSGLDIDALKIVSKGVNHRVGPDFGLLVITHYERLLSHIQPQHLHILMGGRIVKSGGPELVRELEARGYDWIREEVERSRPEPLP